MKRPDSRASVEVAFGHYQAGSRDKARVECERVLKRDPREARALFLLGTIDLDDGRAERAVERLKKAVGLAPSAGPFWSNLGLAHAKSRDFERAEKALTRALELAPNLVEATFNLGLVHLDRGDPGAALPYLGRAAEQRPGVLVVQRAYARALVRAGQVDEGLARFRSTLGLAGGSTETHLEFFSLLELHGRHAEAEAIASSLVAEHPTLAEAHVRLGQALAQKDENDAALACFQRAVELDPTHAAARRGSALTLLELGCLEEAIPELERAVELDPAVERPHSNLVFYAAFSPAHDAARILEAARRFDERHTRPLAARRQPHENDPSPDRRLRIGYVSPELRDHSQRLFTLPVLREHDHERFEIVCYSSTRPEDAWTDRLRDFADAWHDVANMSNEKLAAQIRDQRIDVLVDLTMHMSGQRLKLFAEKPAPVQMAWLAYPGTTGVGGIDYRLTDPHLDPPAGPLPYSEQSLWLPSTFWCYDPASTEPAANELPALSNGYVTFGCLNNFLKVNRGVLELWARVLQALPTSRLLLLAPSERARAFALRVLESNGVDPGRVELTGLAWRKDYLRTYHRIDVALDCVPYNGHTTSLDAFWMGVPVVSLVGQTVVGRAGLCQAQNLALPELAVDTAQEFVARSVELAADLPRLATLRRRLRSRLETSPLMDARSFTRALEAAYREAWERWCSRVTPGA